MPEIPGYRIVAELGHGGMGVVYHAEHLKLGREVALKLVLEGLSEDPRAGSRFKREIKSLMALQHPNIIRVYDCGEVEGRWFYTMELLTATALDELVKAGAQLPAHLAAKIIRQAADALAYCHQAGLVHRDIKPANVMADPHGRVTVMDFGLARMDGQTLLTGAGQLLGTPGYLAPESLSNKEQDPAGDVYALGVMFYELLAGRRAFGGSSLRDLFTAVAQGKVEPLAGLRPDLPAPVLQLVGEMMGRQLPRPTAAEVVARIDGLGELPTTRPGKETLSCAADPPAEPATPGAPASLATPATAVGSTSGVTSRPGARSRTGTTRKLSIAAASTPPPPPAVPPAARWAAAGLVTLGALGIWWMARPRPPPVPPTPSTSSVAVAAKVTKLAVTPLPPRRVQVALDAEGVGSSGLVCTVREGERVVSRAPLGGGGRTVVLAGLAPGGKYVIEVLAGTTPLEGARAELTMPRPIECALDVSPSDDHLTFGVRHFVLHDFEVWVKDDLTGQEKYRQAAKGVHSFVRVVRGLKPNTDYRVGLTSLDPARYPAQESVLVKTREPGQKALVRTLLSDLVAPGGAQIAAVRLADLGEPDSVPEIVRLLRDPATMAEDEVMMQLTRAVANAHDSRAIAPLAELAKHTTEATRCQRLAFALGKTYDPSAFDTILTLGNGIRPEPEFIQSYACALVRSDPLRAREHFKKVARSPGSFSLPERLAAAHGAYEARDPGLADTSADLAIAAHDELTTRVAARALCRIGGDAGRAALARMLSEFAKPGADPGALELTLIGLTRCGVAATADVILPFLEPARPSRVRVAAIHGLGQLGAAKLAARVLPLLNDADVGVSRAAAGTLARLATRDAVQPLIALLAATSEGQVPRALGSMGAGAAVPALLAKIAETKPGRSEELDRADALWALARLGEKRALPLLRHALAAADPYTRVRAAEGLTWLGDKSDLPALERAFGKAPAAVKQMIEAARLQIASGARPTGVLAIIDAARPLERTGIYLAPGDRFRIRATGAWSETATAPVLKGPTGGGEPVAAPFEELRALAFAADVGPGGPYRAKDCVESVTATSSGELVVMGNARFDPNAVGFLCAWIEILPQAR